MFYKVFKKKRPPGVAQISWCPSHNFDVFIGVAVLGRRNESDGSMFALGVNFLSLRFSSTPALALTASAANSVCKLTLLWGSLATRASDVMGETRSDKNF